MRAERALDQLAVYLMGARPTLWCSEHDDRPRRTRIDEASFACVVLNLADAGEALAQDLVEVGVDLLGVATRDEVHSIAVTREQTLDVGVARAAQDGRACDFVTVEVQDGQHGAVTHRIQEADAFPRAL